jgi:phosphoribosyl 1,2-cyclic phosphate 1,2-diphosphodiesterase
MRGDLHVHSDLSDGSLSVRDILAEARTSGLDFIAVTDHDCVDGGIEAERLGPAFGIQAIRGIEISARDRRRGRRAHLLAYLFDLAGTAARDLCATTLAARDAMTRGQVETLRAAGYPISIEEVVEEAGPSTALYKQHVMAALTRKGAADGIDGRAYRSLFKDGGICDREIDYPEVFAALEAVHADGGLAILAHPGEFDSWDLLYELASAGLDGVELYHPKHGLAERCKAIAASARFPGLILAGGSDFHGAYGSGGGLGHPRAPGGALAALRLRKDAR